jgi:hypothetical protein
MNEACSVHGRDEKCVQNVRKRTEWKKSLGMLGLRWNDNTKVMLMK